MCHISVIVLAVKNLTKEEIRGRRVIEVGSYDVNGSVRPIIESWEPAEYIGADIRKGPGVDIVCDAENLVARFGKESFDVVISTELLEHVRDWKRVVSNIKNICKPNGIILITTRSYGFAYHGYPYDFWRYELGDIKQIFSDFQISALDRDYQAPGVCVKARKGEKFIEKDLSDFKLYSIVTNKRVNEIIDEDFRTFYFMRLALKEKLKNSLLAIGRKFFVSADSSEESFITFSMSQG